MEMWKGIFRPVPLFPGVSFHIAAGNEGVSGTVFNGRYPRSNLQEVEFNVRKGLQGLSWNYGECTRYLLPWLCFLPEGRELERIQLKMDEFRRIHFFPEKTELQIHSLSAKPLADQVIRMNFGAPSAGIWKMKVYAAGEEKKPLLGIWISIRNFLKEETFFLDATATETVTRRRRLLRDYLRPL